MNIALKKDRTAPRSVSGRIEQIFLALTGPELRIRAYRERPWASATFVGARLYWTCELSGAGSAARADSFCKVLPSHEFTLNRYLVADIIVTERHDVIHRDGQTATILCIEMLVVENG